jgi:hypothetical protein
MVKVKRNQFSTNSRQQVSGEEVHDPLAADAAVQDQIGEVFWCEETNSGRW